MGRTARGRGGGGGGGVPVDHDPGSARTSHPPPTCSIVRRRRRSFIHRPPFGRHPTLPSFVSSSPVSLVHAPLPGKPLPLNTRTGAPGSHHRCARQKREGEGESEHGREPKPALFFAQNSHRGITWSLSRSEDEGRQKKRRGQTRSGGTFEETGTRPTPPSPSRITPTHEVPTTTEQETGGENTTSG